jgi:hypothetical protein
VLSAALTEREMELLFFLVVATVCILGVVAGNAAVATFVSLLLGGMIFLAAEGDGPASGTWIVGCIIALAFIWGRVASVRSNTPNSFSQERATPPVYTGPAHPWLEVGNYPWLWGTMLAILLIAYVLTFLAVSVHWI